MNWTVKREIPDTGLTVWVDEANHAARVGGLVPEDTKPASWPEAIASVEKRVNVLRAELDALRWWLEAAKEGRRTGR